MISVLVIDQFIIFSTYESMKHHCDATIPVYIEMNTRHVSCIGEAEQWKIEQYSKYGIRLYA